MCCIKREAEQEVKNKFYNDVEENMLEDIICELEENWLYK